MFRVWRTGDSKDKFSVRTVMLKQAKVMSVAWHPSREGLLCYEIGRAHV